MNALHGKFTYYLLINVKKLKKNHGFYLKTDKQTQRTMRQVIIVVYIDSKTF